MNINNKKLITTAIAYSNASPHIGHILEYIMSDVYNRYLNSVGQETYFTTGMDEHGMKIFTTSQNNNQSPQDYVNGIAERYINIHKRLNINYDQFTRTTDNNHKEIVAKLWNKLIENDDLYKEKYTAKYCMGCESFKTDSDLINGLCPDHQYAPENIDEENYFFRISKYKDIIKDKIKNNEIKIIPESKKNEILNLIDKSENTKDSDVSFSRPADKVK
ncbi:MAG: class I tRNA ligase family protein [Cyanobium sp. MAG06]|nr:class I tRNA ligase family protein [Cyanobium sp. MAG06]